MSEADQPLIPCGDAVRQMWDYLDGAVTPLDQDQMEAHLAFCRRCCGELEFVAQLRDMLASQASDEIPPRANQRLERFISEL